MSAMPELAIAGWAGAREGDAATYSLYGAVSLIATRLRLAHEGRKWPTSGRNILPLGQRGRATDLVSLTVDEVALLVKMVVETGVDRNELL